MLKKPILALTKNRDELALENDICGNPENWFRTEGFKRRGINAASFDFFVDWEKKEVCDEVWIKRISDSEDIFHQSKSELRDSIVQVDGEYESKCLYYFLKKQKFNEKYMLFRDVSENVWEQGNEKVVELNLTDFSRNAISYLSVDEIQNKIRELRKRPAPIGRAGLIYATSALEGYLSKKSYFWPGDVDTVLYDVNNEAIAILEFKKHTAKSRKPFEEQTLANYIETDRLKYESLGLLRDKFHTDLYIVYYPISSEIDYIWIEKAEGSYNSLRSDARYRLQLPDIQDEGSMNLFADNFMQLIQ